MTPRFMSAGMAALAVLLCVAPALPASPVEAAAVDTVHVASPTGERDADRASILAALEQVRPGGTVQFAPGTYLIGGRLDVSVPGITLLGHPDGTTLRGCEPEEFAQFPAAVVACSALQLTGGHQTVRGLIFESSWFGLHVGCCAPADMAEAMAMQTRRRDTSRPGGYVIEGNVFRSVSNGLYVLGESPEPTVIRGNRFVDSYHAVIVGGRTAHVLDNEVSVPEPGRVPYAGHPGGAIVIVPLQVSDDVTSCAGNVVAGNRIEGHPDAIGIMVTGPATACRDNVIRDNTVLVRRARFARPWPGIRVGDAADSTVVGVPIGLFNLAVVPGRTIEPGREPILEGNRIQNNHIIGAEGIAIEVRHASRNTIAGNSISGVRVRDPFPGNTLPKFPGEQPTWGAANGAGIWVSARSDENEITGNVFDDVASDAVVLEGDRNRVETVRSGDTVRDAGNGNRVSGVAEGLDPSPHTVRFVTAAPDVRGVGTAIMLSTERTPLQGLSVTPRDARVIDLGGVVHVGAPAGDQVADRATILAALEQVRPGGTIQFAPGTYVVGEMIHVAVPDVTLLGHPEGTTLRGCNPGDVAGMQASMDVCNGLELAGARQTVRGFTFEHAFWALHLGCCYHERTTYTFPDGSTHELPVVRRGEGGHVVEGNTFRSAASGIRVNGGWTEPSIVRGNRFIDNWHGVSINGNTVHVLDNHFAVPHPERVPDYGYAWDAIKIAPPMPLQGETGPPACIGNVVAGNTIEGYVDGIRLEVYLPGSICRQNVIRDNAIRVRRAHNPSGVHFRDGGDPSDSSVVGVPIALLNDPVFPEYAGSDAPAVVEANIVADNRILGAHGIGIEVLRASHNRIVNNTIERVVAREPFPGNTMAGAPDAWRHANGPGIWISPGSDGNEVDANSFDDIAGTAVVLEGNGNRVRLRRASDAVQDLGTGNRVSGAATDTARYTAMPGGILRGERLVWLDEPNTLRYAMLFGPPGAPNRPRLESTVELDGEGIPISVEVRGFQPHGASWQERFERRGDTVTWSTPAGQGSKVIAGPAYYPSLLAGPMYHPWPALAAYDLGLLARALLRRPNRSLPLLPDGEARLEEVERRVVEVDGRTRSVALYAIHGLDLAPAYVWLDERGEFFADRVVVAAGWETVHSELAQASRAALIEHARERLAGSMASPREWPLVIRGARLFDPTTRTVRDGTTIVVEGRRIVAVGPDASVATPPGSEVIDAAGRMALPGLWDMHVHFQPGWSEELSAPLFIAAGVTTTRDLGGETDLVVSLRRRIESGDAVGPRILPALIMYGPGQHPLGAGVGTAEDARQAVDRFAALGYVQLKLYNPVPPDLLPVIAERARHHGMRVSGHIPNGMTGEEAIEGGFDELQHLLYARVAAAGIRNLGTDSAVGARLAAVRVGSDEWERFVKLLRARGTVIDATLAVVEESVGLHPAVWLSPVLDRLPTQAARVASLTAGPPAPPPMLREHWDEIVANGPDLVRALHEAGVALVIGTDAPMGGVELHREMELFVRAGIPAPDVLQLATLGAARVMGMDDALGSIEPGKIADLILVDGDPTTEIRDIRRVMTVVKDGRVYDPAAVYGALGIRPCCDESSIPRVPTERHGHER